MKRYFRIFEVAQYFLYRLKFEQRGLKREKSYNINIWYRNIVVIIKIQFNRIIMLMLKCTKQSGSKVNQTFVRITELLEQCHCFTFVKKKEVNLSCSVSVMRSVKDVRSRAPAEKALSVFWSGKFIFVGNVILLDKNHLHLVAIMLSSTYFGNTSDKSNVKQTNQNMYIDT